MVMVRAWGVLVAILALACHTTRIFVAAEDLGGSEIDDESNEVLASAADMAARKQYSSGYECFASMVFVLTLAAFTWATRPKSPGSRRDEHEARLLVDCRNELRRAREEMKIAVTRENNLVTEVVWWQELHVDELHEKQRLRKELRLFRDEIEPSLLAELDRNEKLVKLLDSRLDAIDHPCTTCFPSTGGDDCGSGGSDGKYNNVGGNDGGSASDHSKEEVEGDSKLVDQLTQLMLDFPRVGCDRAMRSQQNSNVGGNDGGGDVTGSSKKGGDGDGKERGDVDGKEGGHGDGKEVGADDRGEGEDGNDRGKKSCPGPKRDGVNKEGKIWTGRRGSRRSVRHAEHTYGGEFGQLVRSLVVKDLNAKCGLTQRERRNEGGEARGSRGCAEVEQDEEEMVRQVMRSLPSFSMAHVHTEGGRLAVGEDKVDGLGAEKEKQEEAQKHPEPSSCVDGECAGTGEATARGQTAGQRRLKSTAAGSRQPEALKTVQKGDLARAPPFTLPSVRKCLTFRDLVGPPRTSAVGRTAEVTGAQNVAGQQRTSAGAAADQVLAGRQRSIGGEHAGKPSSDSTSLKSGTPVGGPQLKVKCVNEPAVTVKKAAAPAANVPAPPFLAGGCSRRADDEWGPYAFGRRFASRGVARSEEKSAPPSRFTFGNIGAPESSTSGALPGTAVVAPKGATSSLPSTAAVAQKETTSPLPGTAVLASKTRTYASPTAVGSAPAPYMGVAGDGGSKGTGLVPHTAEPGWFSPTVVGSAAVPLLGVAGDGGGKGKGHVSHASTPGCCSFGTTQAENRAVSRFIVADGRVVDLHAFAVAPVSPAKTSAAKSSAAVVAPAKEPARPSHRTSRSEGETPAFSTSRSAGETPVFGAVVRDTDVGTSPAQGSPAFSAVGDTDVGTPPAQGSPLITSNSPPMTTKGSPLIATQDSTTGSDIIRRRAKFVIGRHRVNDSPNLRAMKARLLAKQEEFKRLAAIDNRTLVNEAKLALQHCLTTGMRDHDDGEDADNCNEKNDDDDATDDDDDEDGDEDSEEVTEVGLEGDSDGLEGASDDQEGDSDY